MMSQPGRVHRRGVEWMSQAVCASITDWGDHDAAAQVEVCRRWCPVALPCLDYALTHEAPVTTSACVVYVRRRPHRTAPTEESIMNPQSIPPVACAASLLADAVEDDVRAGCASVVDQLTELPSVTVVAPGETFVFWGPTDAAQVSYVPSRVFLDERRGGLAYGSEVGVPFAEAEAFALRILAAARYARQHGLADAPAVSGLAG